MKLIRLLLCLILAAALCLSLAACQSKEQVIDWTLYGAWISESAEASEQMTFELSGIIPKEAESDQSSAAADFSISWPEDFPYQNPIPNSFAIFTIKEDNQPAVYRLTGFSADAKVGGSIQMTSFICVEKEYAIFMWDDGATRYLVASTNPEEDPKEILDYFQAFIDEFDSDNQNEG